ncbi:hypothetical protein DL546_009709 [Coniochaeta pulveracea]|uniref:Uncharacterized protein n=1 Tax=Coniochaeta pulveracea TaxID=177199 RepID=A0A420YN19_9PEZI|nr:hypothetical protein DL546_009709 [Coniochaeta pulveracea]
MAREGTRSQTGHSKPRVFATVDTEPAVKRTTKPKTVKKSATAAKPTGARHAGVTKKKAAPKNESGVAKKVEDTAAVCSARLSVPAAVGLD